MTDDDNPFTIGFFGPPSMMKSYERQVAPPLGQPCAMCDEAIAAGDIGTVERGGRVIHYECMMRSVIGSVGHQKKLCSCYGGDQEDDPALTRREAAKAAVAYFHKTKPLHQTIKDML